MKPILSIAALALLSISTANVASGALIAGQSLGIDLGNVTATNSFNVANASAAFFTGSPISGLVDIAGGSVSGVTMQFNNFGSMGTIAAAPGGIPAPFDSSNTIDYASSMSAATITLNGLDDALIYRVTIVAALDTWTTVPNTYTVAGISADPIDVLSSDNISVLDNITISGGVMQIVGDNSVSSYGGVFNSVLIEAFAAPVPEPSTALCGGLAGLLMLTRRRRTA